ncbi:MAG: NADH-quinone oxidoreductase subunit C [Candidatus Omnitrophota bacterium]|nr:NADH-quinone oxidoreductase subunit C [Candidatus Omnitrophota bacterium]
MTLDLIDEIKERLSEKLSNLEIRSARRIYSEVNPKNLIDVAKVLFMDLGLRFVTASGVDAPQAFEILYHFSFDKTGQMFSLRVFLKDKDKPEIESITPLFKAAEWIEREMHEILGIDFKNHPNLSHLLLADDWPEGEFPLRHKHKEEKNEP